jgi:Uma2 family endonuclease
MNVMLPTPSSQPIEYPDDDGKPMANNSQQGDWIVFFIGNLRILLREVVEVYLAVDHLWYPLEGHPEVRNAPDVMVVFGRKRGKRGSYKQWQEDNVPVSVAIEILSPANTWFEMADKLAFYDEHGVQEYYIYDPESNRLDVYLRQGDVLRRVRQVNGFVSPLLHIRFDLSGLELAVFYPDGRRFLTPEELEAERLLAEQRAREAQQRAEKAEENAVNMQRCAERQTELTRRVLQGQATSEELQELQQLLEQQPPSL